MSHAPESDPNVRIIERAGETLHLMCGEGFVDVEVPKGTRVLYCPPPRPGLPDVRAAVERALDHPVGSDPLDARLRPGMKVTIAFDDISLPLPQMRSPDARQVILEVLLERLARKGVTDIHLIAALALHRRMTPQEIRHAVGPKVFGAHFRKGTLYNHDAEDPDGMVLLGTTAHGEPAWMNRRAAESDLVLYVNINLVTMDGGHKSVGVGLTSYPTLKAHHNVHALMHSKSYMDPKRSAMHGSVDRIGRLVNEHLNVFTVETTLDSSCFGFPIGHLLKRETTWSGLERAFATANRVGLDLLPMSARRAIFHAIKAPYAVTGVNAGATEPVHEITVANVREQQLVRVQGQSDIVIVGLPFVGPYNVNSILNPLLVNCLGLGYAFNMYVNKPLVKKGGVMIFLHPLEEKFHPVHHPSYIQFYEEVLADTRNPAEIEAKYEKQYAEDPRYIDLYRNSYAYHGVHPLYMWYWACHGMDHVGQAIYVAPRSERACRRIGGVPAKSLAEALEMAKGVVGTNDPSISVFHMPPILLAEVQ